MKKLKSVVVLLVAALLPAIAQAGDVQLLNVSYDPTIRRKCLDWLIPFPQSLLGSILKTWANTCNYRTELFVTEVGRT